MMWWLWQRRCNPDIEEAAAHHTVATQKTVDSADGSAKASRRAREKILSLISEGEETIRRVDGVVDIIRGSNAKKTHK